MVIELAFCLRLGLYALSNLVPGDSGSANISISGSTVIQHYSPILSHLRVPAIKLYYLNTST